MHVYSASGGANTELSVTQLLVDQLRRFEYSQHKRAEITGSSPRSLSLRGQSTVQRRACFSFGKQQRLLTPSAFKHVFSGGKRHHDPLFLVVIQSSLTESGRIGLAVSKKVSRLAVVRNRIKRYIREAYRHEQARFAGLDVVVVARSPSASASASDIREALIRIADRQQRQNHHSTS